MPCKKMPCGANGSNDLRCDSLLEVSTLKKPFNGKKMSCGLKGSDALLLKHRDSPLEVGTLNKSFEGKKMSCGLKGSDALWLKNRDSPLEASPWKKSFNGLLFGNSIIDETHLRSSTVTPKFLPSKYSVGRDGSNDVVIEGKSSDTTRKMSSVSSGLGPLLQQGRSATVLKSMPSFIFRRRFCNAAGDFSNSEANGASTKITLGNSKVLLAKITDAKAKWSSRLQVSRLKRMYSRSVRHEFLSRFLIAPGALHHKSTEFLSFQSYLMNNRDPQYITSFELMIRKTGFNTEEEWICFRNHLIETRTFIVEDWQSTSNVGNIETLYYDYGIKDTPGVEFMKGESDASFQEGSKKANLSVIIWKGNRVIWAEVFRDVDCPTSIAAEAYAALALLFKCIELGYLNVVFYTDCRAIKEAISGLLTIRQGNPDNELLLLLRCIQSEFDRLIPIWKPRELNFLADDLASRNSTHCLQEALKKWSHHLSGKPLFKISQAPEANDIINKFVFREYNKPEESKYFMVVDQDKKIDALLQITETLCPRNLYVTIDGFGDKPQEFQMRIKELFGDKHASGVKGCLLLSTMVNAHADRNLLVALDTTVPEIIHAHKGIFTVILASPEERALLPKGIKELNALGYVYFHGVRKVNICKKEQLKWKVWKQQLTTAKKQHGK